MTADGDRNDPNGGGLQSDLLQSGNLRMWAEDADDLAILSACLQDAVTRVGDIAWLPGKRRFAMMANRFRWEQEIAAAPRKRIRTGLHVENVQRAQIRNILLDRPEGILNLLALRFEERDAPSGILTLSFSGGAEIALHVEALDVHLSDMGAGWDTPNLPAHNLEKDG